MKKTTLALLIFINVAVISLGGFLVYYDLWMRRHTPIKIEYYFLGYRPTYRVLEGTQYINLRGSWTLDFLQVSILVMAVVDVVWLLTQRRRTPASL